MRRVGRHHLACHQPIEQHADAGEMLLDRRRRHLAAQLLDIASNMHRLHVLQPTDPLPFAPVQKRGGSAAISNARVFVADVDGEEFNEAQRGPLPCSVVSAGNEARAGTEVISVFIIVILFGRGCLFVNKCAKLSSVSDGLEQFDTGHSQ